MTRGAGRGRTMALVAAGLACVGLVTPARAGSTEVVAPDYEATLGGGLSGHAAMYPSGLDLAPDSKLYIADTGDDQIQAYLPGATSTPLWVTGSRGSKAPGRFDNPRDVAYLDGKVYVADTGYKRVQVLDAADGSVEGVWSQAFGTIMGISAGVNAQGNPIILVSESSSSSIEVYTAAGSFIRSVGSGPGTGACQLNDVRDAATDGDGNIYAADYKNNRMVKFNPTGTICQPFSGTGTGPGQLKRPYGVDVDRFDRVYVADGNDRIQKFAADGTFLGNIYGARGTGPGKFSMLRRVAVGHWNSPKVCGADLWTYKIECFSQSGAYLRSYPQPVVGPATGSFNEPYGVAVDSKVFVMDTTNQRVQRLSGSGAFELAWGERGWGEGNPGFNWARDLTTLGGTSGTIWVADTKNSRLLEFTRDGVHTGEVLGKLGSALGDLNWPFAISAYGDDLIVADTKNHRIQRWDPDVALPMWTAGGFGNPKDVTVVANTVYVADSDNKRIVRLDAADGSFIDAFGQPTLHRVEGVAVEPNGDVWVSDTSWNRLVEFSSAGAFLQKFGAIGSTHGKFNQPAHLHILPGSPVRLYVADQWNDRIEIFTVT